MYTNRACVFRTVPLTKILDNKFSVSLLAIISGFGLALTPALSERLAPNVAQGKLDEHTYRGAISLRDFGAKCDGVTDDTVAVQTALNNLSRYPRIVVPGVCLTSGSLNITQSGNLEGFGSTGAAGAISSIVNKSATSDTITVRAEFVRIHGVRFTSSIVKTAGAYIFGKANHLFIDDIFCDTPFQCINADGVSVGYFSGVKAFWYSTPQSKSTIFEIGGNGGDIRISNAYSVGPVGAGPLSAVHVTQTAALAIENSTFERTGKGLFIDTLPGGIGVASVRTHGTYFDNQQNNGVDIYANGAMVTRVDFDQSWASSTISGSGVRMLLIFRLLSTKKIF